MWPDLSGQNFHISSIAVRMKRSGLFCGFCHSSTESTITGPLLSKDDIVAHRSCLFYSSNIVNENTPDDDDLLGFRPEDVKEEIRRGGRLKCAKCKKSGATVGCEVKKCKKSYHYPCAVEDNAENIEDDEEGIFKIYCRLHKTRTSASLDDSDENDNVAKSKRPRLSNGAVARRILDDGSSVSDESQNGVDPELGPLEFDLEDSGDLTDEPKPSTSGVIQQDKATPSAVTEKKANGRTDLQILLQKHFFFLHKTNCNLCFTDVQVSVHNGDADETDIDSDQESQSLLIPLKITMVKSLNPDHSDVPAKDPCIPVPVCDTQSSSARSTAVSGSETSAPGTSAAAVQFWRKCREAGCVDAISRTFISTMNAIFDRIQSEQASEEDCVLSQRVLETSGMLPEILAQKDKEYEDHLLSLQKEMQAVMKSRSSLWTAVRMQSQH
ncbi:hypothetical protein GJAV_G00213200 [Gymnothorax javanicus]|nr:hypothetical protein GJAV_G00213200 [Gymnothorax javanicus]